MQAMAVRCGLFVAFALLGAGSVGCVKSLPFTESVKEPTQREKDLDVGLIGDVTEVGNINALKIHGVGLVTGLDGTGDCPPGPYRDMLENEMKKRKVEGIKRYLDSPDNALVIITAVIPPGARKGDRIDLEVTLPEGSKTSSLQGGYLNECLLRNYESMQNINVNAGSGLLEGHVLGHGSGPLLVAFGNTNDPAEQRRAAVWGGGVTHIDRPFVLVLKEDRQFARVANVVAERINLQFHDSNQERAKVQQKRFAMLDEMTNKLNQQYTAGFNQTIAKAVNKDGVLITSPYEYRFNPTRYLRVVRLTPLQNLGQGQAKYVKLLEEMLLEPGEALRAALRLEALGKDCTSSLEHGLQSEHAFVRFCAAESLAYLGSTAGCEELARLASSHSQLSGHCLLALASLDEPVCHAKLIELMESPNAELRCGAFQVRRLMTEHDPRAQKGRDERPFSMFPVAPRSPKLVYFSISKRAEVVLFGDEIIVRPLKIVGKNFSIISEPADETCLVTRYIPSKGPNGVFRETCSKRLDDILLTMAKLGGSYTDVVEFLRDADREGGLPCALNANALPELTPVEILAERAGDPAFLDKSGG